MGDPTVQFFFGRGPSEKIDLVDSVTVGCSQTSVDLCGPLGASSILWEPLGCLFNPLGASGSLLGPL